MDKKRFALRFLIYLAGMVILALGLTLSTRVSMGVSPVISISAAFSGITGVNIGNTTFVLYCVLVVIQVILRLIRKEYKAVIPTLLQLALSLIFTRFMNLFVAWIPNFATDCAGTWMGTIVGRVFFMLISIVLIGVGAATTLNMRLVPNPGDGMVQALSDCTGKSAGFCKNCLDLTCVAIACLCGLIFSGKIHGVGVGTLCAMLLIGRVISLFNHFVQKPMLRAAGMEK